MMAAIFPYNSRIGRGEYALRLLACLALSAPVLAWRGQVVRAQRADEALLFLAVLLIVLLVIHAQMVARLRDMRASVFLSGLVLVPYLNAAAALAFLLFPSAPQQAGQGGQAGQARQAAEPRPGGAGSSPSGGGAAGPVRR